MKTTNRNLLILGAGQYGMVAKETAEAMCCFDQINFLDDSIELAIGKLTEYEKFSADYRYGFVAIGNPDLRLKLIHELERSCYTVAVLVHPRAAVAPSAQLYQGTIVEPMAVVSSNVTLAIGCIISAGGVVNHNCFIGDGCHIDCNGTVMSNTIVLAKTKVPCGQVYFSSAKTAPKKCPDHYCFEDGV